MKFEKNIDSNTILVSSVSDGDAVVLETLGYTHSSVNDREIDGRNGFKIGCECWTKKEEESTLGAFVLTTYYSFDSDMPVWMFATEEEARAELKRQFDEELRIQTEENEHVLGEDLETAYTDEWDFASISIDFENTKDVMEWKVSQVRTDKGVGSEIPVPAKDDFMNPPEYDGSDLQKDINNFVKGMEEKYGKIEKSSSLISIMYDFINGSMVAYKVWNRDDIASAINISNTPSTYQVSNEDVDAVIDEAINQLELGGGIDTLEDCTDEEWSAINDAVRKAMKNVNPKITISNINWDVDKEDFDMEAEYEAVINNLPTSVDIAWSDWNDYDGEIADYLSDTFYYCVKSYEVGVQEVDA